MKAEDGFVGMIIIVAMICVAVAITSVSVKKNIIQDCKRHGAFYINDQRFACNPVGDLP